MHYNFDEIINREGTNCVKYDLRKVIFNKEEVMPMWVADMDFKTPDFIINSISKRLDHEILGYTYIPKSYLQSIVSWNKRRHNWQIKDKWISFAPGVVPALSLLVMTFSQPGDSIIVQPPVYFPFFSVVTNHKRKLITNPLKYENGEYIMDLDDLERKIENNTRMMFLCNPHNPTGNIWSPETLRRLGEICLKHNIILISDEIHSDLILPGYKHTPTASLSNEIAENTITCRAPSKTFNLAGLSTSYLIISNSKLREQYERTLDVVHVGAGNIFGFIASEAAYDQGENWLNDLMEYLSGNLKLLNDFISNKLPMIKVMPLQATYLAWLDCRGIGLNHEELKLFMINEAGLGLSDGLLFGNEGEGFQRINIGCPRQVLYNALKKLHKAVDKYF